MEMTYTKYILMKYIYPVKQTQRLNKIQHQQLASRCLIQVTDTFHQQQVVQERSAVFKRDIYQYYC